MSSLGGQPLAGSGFEYERPASGFSAGSSTVNDSTPTSGGAPRAGGFAVGDPIMWSPDGAPALPPGPGQLAGRREAAPGVVAGFDSAGRVLVRTTDAAFAGLMGGSNGVAPVPSNWVRRPTGQEQRAYGSDFSQLAGASSDASGARDSTAGSGARASSMNAARAVDRTLSDAANNMKRLGNRLGSILPPDGAPHAAPPRMPIEHEGD